MSAKLRTAWAISSGEYSDYSVHAICADKATAQAWVEALRGDPGGWHSGVDVEEIPFVPAGTEPYRQTTVTLMQELWDDGREGKCNINESSEYPIVAFQGDPPRRPSVRFIRAPVHNGEGGRLEIRGRTRKAVLKVYGDQIRMWRVNPLAYKR